MLINPNESECNVTTRDGAPVILFAHCEHQPRPYIGAIWQEDRWLPVDWTRNGKYLPNRDSGLDLKMVAVHGE